MFPLRWPASWNGVWNLDVLKGTPVGCLLDAPQDVAAAAESRGLKSSKRDALPDTAFVSDPVWPGVRASQKADVADAGPTGAPWIDSNGWNIALTQAEAAGKTVWVESAPEKGAVLRDGSYLLALAEPEIYGARWVINLDDEFAKGVAAGEGNAAGRWKSLMSAARFFDSRRAWSSFDRRAKLAVVSSFAGSSEFLGKEFLNMADRRNLPYRIVTADGVSKGLPGGPQAVLWIDEEPPGAGAARVLRQFVNDGGLLIASRGSRISGWGASSVPSLIPGYETKALGKGRVAVPAQAWDDPYILARDARILIGRRTDVLRLFNTGSMAALYARSNSDRRGIVHLLNYTLGRGARDVSVAPGDRYTSAAITTLDHPTPEPAKVVLAEKGFSEVAVPQFSVYAAVELTGSKET